MNKKRERQQHQHATANCGTGYEIKQVQYGTTCKKHKRHNATMNS